VILIAVALVVIFTRPLGGQGTACLPDPPNAPTGA